MNTASGAKPDDKFARLARFDPADFVNLKDSVLTTDSRRVAKHFGKRHANVLRAYDQLSCSPEFSRLNFEPREFLDSRGKTEREVRMTKDGFIFLVMGFTGAEASRMKESYIRAFNSLADQLTQIGLDLWSQRIALERKDSNSFTWAQFGSRVMLERKRALPGILDERRSLQDQMQPSLFPPSTTI